MTDNPVLEPCAYLSNAVVNDLVHREGNVRVNTEHFTQGIFVGRAVHVSIEQISYHVEKDGIVIVDGYIGYRREERG